MVYRNTRRYNNFSECDEIRTPGYCSIGIIKKAV